MVEIRSLLLVVSCISTVIFTGSVYGFVPYRGLSGELSAGYRLIQPGEREETKQQIYTAQLLTGGYLWRPWFADWIVELGLSEVISETESETVNQVITGNASIDLFHRSRFPLKLYAAVQDSSVDLEVNGGSQFRFERYGLIQNYQPASSQSKYVTQIEHNILDDSGSGAGEVSDLVNFNTVHRFQKHHFATSLNLRDSERTESGDTNRTFFFNLNHGYRPTAELSVNTTAAYSMQEQESDFEVSGVSFSSGRKSEDMRLLSTLFWRDTAKPLTATATVDLNEKETQTENGLGDENTSNYRFGGGVRYEFTDAFFANADMGATSRKGQSEGSDSLTTFQTLALTYAPKPIPLRNVNYHWSTGALIRNETGGEEGSRQTIGGNFSHGLEQSRQLSHDSAFFLSWNVDQTADVSHISGDEDRYLLSHGASTTLRHAGEYGYSNLRLFVHDDRNYSDVDLVIQSAGMTASYQQMLSHYSTWNMDFNIGANRVDTDGSVETIRFSSIDLDYRHSRLLGMPRLRFDSELSLRSDSLSPFSTGGGNERQDWKNELNYQIGLLSLKFLANFSRSGDAELNKAYFFKITRRF